MTYTINYIRDHQTGLEYTSNELLLKYNDDPRERTIIRRELYKATKENEEKHLVCSVCSEPLKLCSGVGTRQRLHFRHNRDNKNCPIKTSEKQNQKEIDTIRYNGAKESLRHLELKEFIYSQLVQDSRFKQPEMEKVVKILNEKKSWRRPDVSVIFGNKKIVFEVQLQTTYLNIIVEREEDYKSEQTYIMWFFDSSNMDKFRFSEEDIFYANKSNAFVITNKTMELSINENKFLFYCYYKVPYIQNNNLNEEWKSDIITFDDLNFDQDNYKVYYYDFDKEYNRLQAIVETRILYISKNKQIYQKPSKDIIESSLNKLEDCDNIDDCKIIENDLKSLFKEYNAINNSKIVRTIVMLYSIEQQKVFGWENDSLIWALNNFFYHNMEYAFLIIKMITIKNLWKDIQNKDEKYAFKRKFNQWKVRKKDLDEKEYNGLFITLFPELGKNI